MLTGQPRSTLCQKRIDLAERRTHDAETDRPALKMHGVNGAANRIFNQSNELAEKALFPFKKDRSGRNAQLFIKLSIHSCQRPDGTGLYPHRIGLCDTRFVDDAILRLGVWDPFDGGLIIAVRCV